MTKARLAFELYQSPSGILMRDAPIEMPRVPIHCSFHVAECHCNVMQLSNFGTACASAILPNPLSSKATHFWFDAACTDQVT